MQLEKVLFSIICNVVGKITLFKFLQYEKTPLFSIFTPSGIITVVRFEQSENTRELISLICAGNVIFWILLHCENADSPKYVRFLGNSIFTNPEQRSNA